MPQRSVFRPLKPFTMQQVIEFNVRIADFDALAGNPLQHGLDLQLPLDRLYESDSV